ncbi:MAG: NosD domain-containing protein [Candidatus Paceibacterota bacterium]|jgi:parallel beta-helix repeat protein
MKKKFLELPVHHKIFFATVALMILSACTFAGIFYARKAFTSPAPSFPVGFRASSDPFQRKGEISGTGAHFAVTDSEYLNVTIGSTETVDLKLTSIPKVITMMIEATTPSASGGQATQITLSGLLKNTTYYKYEDDYHHLVQFTSDNNGAYTYAQDISARHFVFIQTVKSTKFISDTGGDCATIGTWNQSTKTCTLTQDISETVSIDGNGITLDGNGHAITITPEYTATGVHMSSKTGVTVKNLTIRNAGMGIVIHQTDHGFFRKNTLANNGMGIYLAGGYNLIDDRNVISDSISDGIYLNYADGNTIKDNTVRNGSFGIIFDESYGNRIQNNTVEENIGRDIGVIPSDSSVCNNTITGNIGSGGRPIGFFNSPTTLNSGTFSELILCNADGSNLRNVTVKGSASKRNNGFFLLYTDRSNFTDLTSDDDYFGMTASDSNGNTFKNMTVGSNARESVSFRDSDSNVIKGLSVHNDYAGISLSNADSNEFDGTVLNGEKQIGIYFSGSASNNRIHNSTVTGESVILLNIYDTLSSNNLIYNNNFIGNSQVTDADGNSFNLTKPIGGNYWSEYDTPEEGCANENNDSFCDAPYVFEGGRDNLSWTVQDEWKGGTGADSFWTEITSETGALILRNGHSLASAPLKQLPNGWAIFVKNTKDNSGNIVTADGYRWYQVKDETDGTQGWMQAGKWANGMFTYKYLKYDERDLSGVSQTQHNDLNERKSIITQSVDDYYNNSNTVAGLKNSDDNGNGISLLKRAGFPEPLILAILAQESDIINFNNEYVSGDYGHGISQVTLTNHDPKNVWGSNDYDNRGAGSQIRIYPCSGTGLLYKNCYTNPELLVPHNYKTAPDGNLYKFYTNTKQSIYSNIKDGMKVLRDKFKIYYNNPYVYENKTWSGKLKGDTKIYTITKSEMGVLLGVRGYNGFGLTSCKRFDTTPYPSQVASKLQNISVIFPGIIYDNSNNLIEKLKLVDQNKTIITICSPGDLNIIDSEGRITGMSTTTSPNVFYDNNTGKQAEVLMPEGEERYQVVGTETGNYSVYFDNSSETGTSSVELQNIPLSLKEIYTYQIHWGNIDQGQKGVTVGIDKNGDGIIEKTITATAESVSDELRLLTGTIVDINPNTVNRKDKNGVITAYIELPSGFSVNTIDKTSIMLNGIPANAKPMAIGDYDKDGIPDLMAKFERSAILPTIPAGNTATLTVSGTVLHKGKTFSFEGQDVIKVIH